MRSKIIDLITNLDLDTVLNRSICCDTIWKVIADDICSDSQLAKLGSWFCATSLHLTDIRFTPLFYGLFKKGIIISYFLNIYIIIASPDLQSKLLKKMMELDAVECFATHEYSKMILSTFEKDSFSESQIDLLVAWLVPHIPSLLNDKVAGFALVKLFAIGKAS